LALLAASIVTATLCWRFVEEPFLRGRIKPRRVLLAGTIPMAGACAAAAALIAVNGFAARFPPQVLRLYASADDYNHRRDACHSGSFEAIPYDKSCAYGAAGAVPSAVVWGDSHGAELVEAIGDRMAPLGGSVLQITASSCPPAVDFDRKGRAYCRAHNSDVLDRLRADPRIRTVFLVADYDTYGAGPSAFTRGIAKSAQALTAAGKRVVLVYPIPIMPAEPPQMLGLHAARGADPASWGLPRAEYDRREGAKIAFLDELAAATRADALHPEQVLCDARLCRAYAPKWGALYFNQNHLSVTGARLVAAAIPQAWLEP
jgi:hypothetical protein